jgi:hypothetical protein
MVKMGAVVEFSQDDIGKSQKNNQLAAITLLKDKVDINKKKSQNDIVKAVRLQYIVTFLITNFKSSKAVWLIKYRIRNFKKFTQKSIYKQTDYLLFFIDGKTARINLLQMKYQFEMTWEY